MTPSDHELLVQWREGDRPAGDALVERHLASMRRFFANKVIDEHDVADLVSQTFLGCTTALERVRDPAGFRNYLYGIATNVLRNYYRRRAKRKLELRDFDSVCLQSLSSRSASSVLMERRRYQAFVDGLRDVPINDQIILELRYFMGLSAKRIAEIVGVPPVTMRGQLMRARARLRDRVEQILSGPDSVDDGLEVERLDAWSTDIRKTLASRFGAIVEGSD